MRIKRWLAIGGFAAAYLFVMSIAVFAQPAILNVSYDVSHSIEVAPPVAQLGGWEKIQAQHFADGAIYDQILVRR